MTINHFTVATSLETTGKPVQFLMHVIQHRRKARLLINIPLPTYGSRYIAFICCIFVEWFDSLIIYAYECCLVLFVAFDRFYINLMKCRWYFCSPLFNVHGSISNNHEWINIGNTKYSCLCIYVKVAIDCYQFYNYHSSSHINNICFLLKLSKWQQQNIMDGAIWINE